MLCYLFYHQNYVLFILSPKLSKNSCTWSYSISIKILRSQIKRTFIDFIRICSQDFLRICLTSFYAIHVSCYWGRAPYYHPKLDSCCHRTPVCCQWNPSSCHQIGLVSCHVTLVSCNQTPLGSMMELPGEDRGECGSRISGEWAPFIPRRGG